MSSERIAGSPGGTHAATGQISGTTGMDALPECVWQRAYSKPAQISPECEHYSLTSDAPSGKEGAAFMALMAEKSRLAALLRRDGHGT